MPVSAKVIELNWDSGMASRRRYDHLFCGLDTGGSFTGGVFALFCGFGLTAALGGFQTYYRTYLLSDYSS